MTAKEILLEQFDACYDRNGWFVALKNTLENLTVEQADWKTENLDNSIAEILAHLNFYNAAYLERFKGVDYVYPTDDNDATFAGAKNEDEWRAEVERFDRVMSEWRTLLEAADESKFDAAVPNKGNTNWATVISNVNAHNAHHAGQIVVVRKLQSSWDKSKGVS